MCVSVNRRFSSVRDCSRRAAFWPRHCSSRRTIDRDAVSLYPYWVTVLARFLKINAASGIPIYVQLVEQIRHAIESCVLSPGDQLMGIRALAQEIVVSPNTVIKAYGELERSGLIEVRHGSGAFVVDNEGRLDRSRRIQAAQSAAHDLVAALRRGGLTDNEIRRCVEAELEIETEEARR